MSFLQVRVPIVDRWDPSFSERTVTEDLKGVDKKKDSIKDEPVVPDAATTSRKSLPSIGQSMLRWVRVTTVDVTPSHLPEGYRDLSRKYGGRSLDRLALHQRL